MTVSTLSLGVTTNRAAEELAALTTALKSFKSTLVEFNQQKAANPLRDMPKEADQAIKTYMTELKTGGTKVVKQAEDIGRSSGQALVNGWRASVTKSGQIGDLKYSLRKAIEPVEAEMRALEGRVKKRAESIVKAATLPGYQSAGAAWWDKVLKEQESAAQKLLAQQARLEATVGARAQKLVKAVTLSGYKPADATWWESQFNRKVPRTFAGTMKGGDFSAYAQSAQYVNAWNQALVENERRSSAATVSTYTHARAMNDAHSAARGLASGFGAMWLTWGNIVPLLAGAAISHGIMQATKAGIEFGYQLTFVKALGDETALTMSHVGEKVLDISRTGLQGPIELANGMRMLAQAGLSAQDSLSALPHVMHLATVGEMTMAEAGVTLAGVMNAFGLDIRNFEHIGDVFAKAAAVSQTSVEQMTQAMKTASVVGEQYGASMEDTATALTLLAKVNITGTAAGTSLRNMLKELYTPAEDVKKVMKQIGLQAVDAKGNLRPFADVIYDLRGKLEQFDKGSQTQILQKLFGERGAKEAIAMLSQTREEWDKLRSSISDSQGFAAKVSKELEETSKGQFIQAKNTLQASMIEAFQGAEEPMREFARALKELAGSEGLKSALETTISAVATLARMAVEALPPLIELVKVLGTFFVLSKGLALASVGWAALGKALAAVGGSAMTVASVTGALAPRLLGLLSPMGLLAAGLTVGVTLWNSWGSAAEDAMNRATKGAKDTLKSLQETLKDLHHAPGMQSAAAAQQAEYAGRKKLEQLVEQINQSRRDILGKERGSKLAIPDLTGDFDIDKAVEKSWGNAWILNDLQALKALQKEYNEVQKTVQEMGALARSRSAQEQAATSSAMRVGKGKFEVEGSGLSSRISAEKTEITDLFNHREKMAKFQYDAEVQLANDAYQRKLLTENEFLAKRAQSELDYLVRVEAAELEALAEIERLKASTDREAQARQLDNASKRISDKIAEQQEQDKLNQKVKVGIQSNALVEDAEKTKQTLVQLRVESTKALEDYARSRDSALMSSTDRAGLEAEVKEYNRYAGAIATLNEKYREAVRNYGEGSDAAKTYKSMLDAVTAAQVESADAAKNAARALDEYHRSIEYGTKSAFATYKDAATNGAEQARQVWSTALSGIEEEMARFIRTGKMSWQGLANAILDQMARIAAARMVVGLMGMFASGAPSNTTPSSGLDTGANLTGGRIQSAKGSFFDGSVARFANGGAFTNAIVSSPTLFRFAQGGSFRQGLMGEAGPEAIMPLARDSSGRLGVRSSGGGDNYNVNISVNVDATGGTQSKQTGDVNNQAAALGRRIESVVREVIIEEKRNGGLLEKVR